MSNPTDRRDLEREIAALRERLSRLSQASLRITGAGLSAFSSCIGEGIYKSMVQSYR